MTFWDHNQKEKNQNMSEEKMQKAMLKSVWEMLKEIGQPQSISSTFNNYLGHFNI